MYQSRNQPLQTVTQITHRIPDGDIIDCLLRLLGDFGTIQEIQITKSPKFMENPDAIEPVDEYPGYGYRSKTSFEFMKTMWIHERMSKVSVLFSSINDTPNGNRFLNRFTRGATTEYRGCSRNYHSTRYHWNIKVDKEFPAELLDGNGVLTFDKA